MDRDNRLLTVAAAARYLSLSRHTIYDLVASAKLTHYRVGRSIRFDQDDLDLYLSRCRVEAREPESKPSRVGKWRNYGPLKHVDLRRCGTLD